MEQNNGQPQDLSLKGFDLGVAGGGMQLIIADKPINENEHYVFTVGNPPQQRLESQKEIPNADTNVLKKAFMSFRDNLLKKKPNETGTEAESNVKLRCFKLSWNKEQQLKAEEYVTWEGIVKVAKEFGFDREQQ